VNFKIKWLNNNNDLTIINDAMINDTMLTKAGCVQCMCKIYAVFLSYIHNYTIIKSPRHLILCKSILIFIK